jgi:cell division protein FtsZ
MGEFEEVGNAIHEFASDNATVVVGTVLDPEMSGELRVTVVATGLGQKPVAVEVKPTKVVDNTLSQRATAGLSTPNYADLDRPAVLRNGGAANYNTQYSTGSGAYAQGSATASVSQTAERVGSPQPADDLDYLDIPAFLRRQAD